MRLLRTLIILLLVQLTWSCSSDNPGAAPRDGEYDVSGITDVEDAAAAEDAAADGSRAADAEPADSEIYDSGDGGPTKDGQALDGDVDDSSDSDSSNDGQSWNDGDCECQADDSVCSASGPYTFCRSEAVPDCRDDECPYGFECKFDDICVCDRSIFGEAACRPACTEDSQCPHSFVCVPGEWRCGKPAWCYSDVGCPADEWCVVSSEWQNRTCQATETKQPGEDCEEDYECDSGNCHWNECRQRCRVNGDCPDKKACTNDGICQIQGECDEEMHDDGSLCTDEYVPPRCQNSGDCPDGDCIAHAYSDDSGYCDESGESYCKDHEFREHPEDPYCRLAVGCDDSFCPSGYECALDYNGATFAHPGVSWCSRRIADWPWPPEWP